MTIETGVVTGQLGFLRVNMWITELTIIAASFSIVTMILAYLPGHTTYYQVAILILAKMYSNSMIAALNSRVRVVSNSQSDSPPSWNESVAQPVDLQQMKSTLGLEFRRNESSGSIESEV